MNTKNETAFIFPILIYTSRLLINSVTALTTVPTFTNKTDTEYISLVYIKVLYKMPFLFPLRFPLCLNCPKDDSYGLLRYDCYN